ncbi:hypothetical protein FACS1894152_2120 [Bacilli bacterium]|nr:hypothetical protein FACS1894152_2120 [Bacilli bacterium]
MVFAGSDKKVSSPEMENSFTFSSAYFEGRYTNEGLSAFILEFLGGIDRLHDYIDNPYGKIAVAAIGIWSSYGLHLALHEVGHGLRGKAFGGDYVMPKDGKWDNLTREERAALKKDENFFKFFARKLVFPHQGYPIISRPNENSTHVWLIRVAGGLNNTVYLSERVSDELHSKGRIGLAESFVYIWGELHPILYSSMTRKQLKKLYPDNDDLTSDAINIEDAYKTLGISAKQNDMVLANTISLLLSGTTYSILSPIFKDSYHTKPGDNYIKPLEYANFRIPDVFSYITTRGISYKVVSGYKIKDDLRLIFGFEQVVHGKSTTELSFGINKMFKTPIGNDLLFKVVTTFGRGFNIEGTLSLPVHKRLSVNLGGASYSTKSLLGERHAVNMENGRARSSNMFISLSYKY